MGLYPTNPRPRSATCCRTRVAAAGGGGPGAGRQGPRHPAADLPLLERIVYIEQRGTDRTRPAPGVLGRLHGGGSGHRQAHPGASRSGWPPPRSTISPISSTPRAPPAPEGSMLTVGNCDFAGNILASADGLINLRPGPTTSSSPTCAVPRLREGHRCVACPCGPGRGETSESHSRP